MRGENKVQGSPSGSWFYILWEETFCCKGRTTLQSALPPVHWTVIKHSRHWLRPMHDVVHIIHTSKTVAQDFQYHHACPCEPSVTTFPFRQKRKVKLFTQWTWVHALNGHIRKGSNLAQKSKLLLDLTQGSTVPRATTSPPHERNIRWKKSQPQKNKTPPFILLSMKSKTRMSQPLFCSCLRWKE